MAQSTKKANENYYFDPKGTATGKRLINYTGAECFRNCFEVDNGGNLTFLDIVNNEINEAINTSNKYPLLRSLIGDPLNYIYTKLSQRITPYIPNGYRINVKQMLTDLENLFSENPNAIRKAAFDGRANLYVADCMEIVSNNFGRAIEYDLSKSL